MSKKRIIKSSLKKDLIWASGKYLCTFLPDDFDKWSNRKLNNFLEKNAWEPIEFWPAEDIWEQIEDLALSVNEYKKQ